MGQSDAGGAAAVELRTAREEGLDMPGRSARTRHHQLVAAVSPSSLAATELGGSRCDVVQV
jgi:hypothetical protein